MRDAEVGKRSGPDAAASGHPERRATGIGLVPTAVLFCAVASFWGMNTVAMRVAGRTVPPLTVAAARALVGGVVLTVIAKRQGATWPRGRTQWGAITAIAVPMTFMSTACLFIAARHAPAGLLAIMSNTMPLFVAVMAPFLLAEATTLRATIGLVIGLGGTALTAWRAIEGDVGPLGIVFGLLGSLTAAIGSVMYRRYPLRDLNRIMVIAAQLLLSALLLAITAIPDDRSHLRFPWTFWLSFAYLSLLGLALSFLLYAELLRRSSGLQGSAVAYLSTVLGVTFGAVLLRERLSWLTLAGGVVTILGVLVVQTAPRRAIQAASPPE